MLYRTHPQQRVQANMHQSDSRSRGHIVSVSRRQSDQALVWLVSNPQDDRHYSTVTQITGILHCACQGDQAHPSECPHLRAVQAWLRAYRQQTHRPPTFEKARSLPAGHQPPKTARREQALPWTDDKAFSIWKS